MLFLVASQASLSVWNEFLHHSPQLLHFTLILVFGFNTIMYRFDCSLLRREGYVAETCLKPFQSLYKDGYVLSLCCLKV